MKEPIRALLVDPIEESRGQVQRLFEGVDDVRLTEVCTEYSGAARRVATAQPEVVIIVIDADPVQAVSLIQTITQNHPEVVVLPASRVRDSSIILRVIRAGAREFLTLPCHPDEVREVVGRLLNRRDDTPGPQAVARGPQVIAVTGAAGGIGCTTVAVNLATTLAKTSPHEVVLADFDLMLGSLDACLDIIPDQTLQGVIQNIDRLDLTLLKRSMTRHASGLYVLPHPVLMEDAAKVDPETLRRVVELLKAAFPTVVIDTSKGLQSADFVAFEMADVILIVIQLDLTCLRNTARLLQLFGQFEGFTERVRLVANRSGSHDSEISLKKAEETLKMPVSWHVPNATKAVHAARAKGVKPAATEPAKPRRGLFAAFF